MAAQILFVGEINLDIILKGFSNFPAPGREVLVEDCAVALGSSCIITAAGLVKLGDSATYFGQAADDLAGRFCLNRMSELGLDVSHVKLLGRLKTGVTVSLVAGGDRSFISYLGATTALTATDIGDGLFGGLDHLHSSSFFLQAGLRPGFADLYARATAHGLTTSLDPACDPLNKWQGLDAVLPQLDVFLPNEMELQCITGERDPERALHLLQNGRTVTAVKLGENGAMALEKDRIVSVEAPSVEPLDPTGAGDCFNAGFLHAWLRKHSLPEALKLGVACGSYATLGLGGTGAQPSEPEALEFFEKSRQASK